MSQTSGLEYFLVTQKSEREEKNNNKKFSNLNFCTLNNQKIIKMEDFVRKILDPIRVFFFLN